MALTYKKLSKYPHSLRRLVDIALVQLNAILTSLTPIWSKYLSKRYQRPGRHYKHDLGSMVALLLIYYEAVAIHLEAILG